jgi:hypothetical protein
MLTWRGPVKFGLAALVANTQLAIRSKLTRSDAVHALDRYLYAHSMTSERYITGSIGAKAVVLRVKSRDSYNSWARTFYGDFVESQDGTVLKGKLKVHIIVKLLTYLAYVVPYLWLIAVGYIALFTNEMPTLLTKIVFLAAGIGSIVGVATVVSYGNQLADRDTVYLCETLGHVLHAPKAKPDR